MEAYNIIRILVVCISGISIFCGYKLFYLVTERQGNLKIEGKDATVTLSDVGPGVFFALFGSAVLVATLLTQPYSESSTESTTEDGTIVSTSRAPASTSTLSLSSEMENLCVEDNVESYFLEGLELLKAIETGKEQSPYTEISEDLSRKIISHLTASNDMQSLFDSILSDSSYVHVYYVMSYHLLSIYINNTGCR